MGQSPGCDRRGLRGTLSQSTKGGWPSFLKRGDPPPTDAAGISKRMRRSPDFTITQLLLNSETVVSEAWAAEAGLQWVRKWKHHVENNPSGNLGYRESGKVSLMSQFEKLFCRMGETFAHGVSSRGGALGTRP